MPITQILLTAGAGGGPPPTFTFTPQAISVDEGSSLAFEIGGTNIPNGTYYWTIETNAGDFATSSGSFSITDNYGVITVTPTADTTTEGEESFTLAIRSGSISGPILESSGSSGSRVGAGTLKKHSVTYDEDSESPPESFLPKLQRQPEGSVQTAVPHPLSKFQQAL